MSSAYTLSDSESTKIVDHFGRIFYEKVISNVETYSQRWKIKSLQLVDYFSVNCIFTGRSDDFGDVVLKIGNPCREVYTEYSALAEYKGRRFCRVLDADLANGIILEERIQPGTPLRDEKSLIKRLSVFTSLFTNLHIAPANAKIYPTYFEWVSRITDYMSKREDHRDLFLFMQKAKNVCRSICSVYNREMLLHGDFHHDNILLDRSHEYRIIDPKGVIGDPVFDISRFILNESFNEDSPELRGQQLIEIVEYLEQSLHVTGNVIKQLYFIEMALSSCWDVESGTVPNLDKVIWAEAMMCI